MRPHHFLAAAFAAACLLAAPNLSAQAATVTCKDGTSSKAGRGACSHHGGVASATATSTSHSRKAASPEATAAPAATPAAPAAKPAATAASTKPAATASSAKPARTARTSENNDPTDAIAKCKDGLYSHSKNRKGACSRHGGVAQWMKN